jgi:hypothetical protein
VRKKLLRKNKIAEKHIEFFALLDACKLQGCPICHLLSKAARRQITELLYEEVNDPYVKDQLRNSLGFCYSHALMLLQSGDSFGIALIYRDLIKHIYDKLKDRNRKYLISVQECPICDSDKESTKNHINTLLLHINDQKLQGEFERSSGLCLQHLRMTLERSNGNVREYLFTIHEQKLSRLLDDLNEFIRKQDYRFQNERSTEDESLSSKRAVHFFVRDAM